MKINSLRARKILDSRGSWTLEVILRTSKGEVLRASVPEGTSRGSNEAVSFSAEKAIQNIEKIINPKLRGISVLNQEKIDQILIDLDGTKNKSGLGANAILGVSLACARAGAVSSNIPLWRYLRKSGRIKVSKNHWPRLFANVINGGLHAHNKLDFQEYMIIPHAANFSKSIEVILKLYGHLEDYLQRTHKLSGVGYEGGFCPDLKNNLEPLKILTKIISDLKLSKRVNLGIDVAASNVKIKQKKLLSLYNEISRKFGLLYLEDPFEENDFQSFRDLRDKTNRIMLVAGDDLTTTNVIRMERAKEEGSISSVIIKPNQIGTVSESIKAIKLANKFGWATVVSHRSGETNDSFVADLAYGLGVYGFKLGAPARGERISKYNRLLEIEKEI